MHIQKNGRDVGVVLSPEQYARLAAAEQKPEVRPVVEELLQESIKKRASLYAALERFTF